MPSAVTRQPHIRSPDELTASVRPLPTPLSCSPIDSTWNFGVKGNQRPDPPTARDRPFMQPAGNVTLSNYASRASLPAPMQGSLPAGGLRLCREGVEPSGTRWKVSDYIILLPRTFPVASWMVLDGAITAVMLIIF